jgi:hypothetical protein
MTHNDTTEHDKPQRGKPSHEEISERAYFIYQEEDGDAVEIWLRAERELTEKEAMKQEPDLPAAGPT